MSIINKNFRSLFFTVFSLFLFSFSSTLSAQPRRLSDLSTEHEHVVLEKSSLKSIPRIPQTKAIQVSDDFYGPGFSYLVYTVFADGSDIYAGGLFRFIGKQKADFIARYNGSTWEPLDGGLNGTVTQISRVNGRLLAGGFFTATQAGTAMNYLTEFQGGRWNRVSSDLNELVYGFTGDGSRLFVGTTTGVFQIDASGLPTRLATTTGGYVDALVYKDGKLYAAGPFTRLNDQDIRYVAVWDGSAWTQLGTVFNGPVRTLEMHNDELHAGGSFTENNGAALVRVAKWTGTAWAQAGNAAFLSGTVLDLRSKNGVLYASGSITGAGIMNAAKLAGASWSGMGDIFQVVWSTEVTASGTAILGGSFATSSVANSPFLVAHNGTTLVLPPGIPAATGGKGLFGDVLAVTGSTGSLVGAGGNFGGAGPQGAYFFSLFNGTNWQKIGEFNSFAESFYHFGGNWYGGGFFTTINGATANRVAVYNGTTWSAMGDGFNGSVDQFLHFKNELYAVGKFTAGGSGTPVLNRIAKWNGATWLPVGDGFDNIVYGMAVHNDSLFVAGNFQNSGTTPVNRVAKWDGSRWVQVGNGFSGGFGYKLASVRGKLYVGGTLTRTGETVADALVVWNRGTWSPVGSGLTGSVFALEPVLGGLFVGGNFTLRENTQVRNLVYWDETEFSEAPQPDRSVLDLHFQGGILSVAGVFNSLGGVPSTQFGQLRGIGPSISGFSPSSGVAGTEITITGEFLGLETGFVRFINVSSLVATSATPTLRTNSTIKVIAPALSAGQYQLVIDGSFGTSTYFTVDSPTITATSGALSGFSATVSNPSSAQSFSVSAVGLSSALTITASANYEISPTSPDNWQASLSVSPISGKIADSTFKVRLKSGLTTGSKPGSISFTSTGATTRTLSLSGTVSAAAISILNSTTAFSGLVGTPSSEQNYNVNASGLTADLLISAPSGYELRWNSLGSFTPSVRVSPSAGSVSGTVSIRLNGGAPGVYTGSVLHASSGVTSVSQPLNGIIRTPTSSPAAFMPPSGSWSVLPAPQSSTIQSFHVSGNVLLAGYTGGIYRSVDNGVTWNSVLITDHILDFAESGGTILAVGYAGVHRSTDAGQTWTSVKDSQWNGAYAGTLAVTFFNNSWWVGTDRGVFNSANATSWTASITGLPTSISTASLEVHGGVLYAGIGSSVSPSSVFQFNGTSWTGVGTGLTAAIEQRGLSSVNGKLYAGTSASGLWVLNGTTWQRASGVDLNVRISRVVRLGNRFAAAGGAGIYQSADLGDTWSAFNTALKQFYLRDVAAKDSTFYGAGEDGVYAYTIGSSSWVKINNGINRANVISLAQSGNNLVISAFGDGLFTSPLAPFQFSAQNSGYFMSLSKVGSSLYTGDHTTILRSNDNGTSWQSFPATGLPNMSKRTFTEFNSELYVGNLWESAGVYKYNGTSWSAINSGLGSTRVNRLAVFGPALFVATENGIFRLTSGSTTWANVSSGTSGFNSYVTDLLVFNSTLYASTTGGVWKSTNGTTWTLAGAAGAYLSDLEANAGRIYASGYQTLYISYDGGTFWQNRSTGLPPYNVNEVTISGEFIVGATTGGVYSRPLVDFEPPTPTITAITTQSGTGLNTANVGTTIVIVGTNFSTTAAQNAIRFGNVSAVPNGSNATQIVTSVPAGSAAQGPAFITVTVLGKTAQSPKLFIATANETQTATPSSVPIVNLQAVAEPASTHYRLVGTPIRGVSPSDFGLTARDETAWRMYRDNGTSLVELDVFNRTKLGEGVWAISRTPLQSPAINASVPVSGNTAVIQVDAGKWNIISNPFPTAITWSAIRAANGTSLNSSILYGFTGSYAAAATLTPYTGYYVNVPAGVTEILIPKPATGKQKSEHLEEFLADWSLELTLLSGGASDPGNKLGVSEKATSGRDAFEFPEPPMVFDLPFLYFHHPDWDAAFPRFSHDFRKPFSNGETWKIDVRIPNAAVKSAPNSGVQHVRSHEIRLSGLESIPADLEVLMLQPETGMLHDFRRNRVFGFQSANDSASFELVVGKKSFTSDKAAQYRPAKLELAQNYPNPFNPSTQISFTIDKPGRVRLAVYDISGRLVRELLNEEKSAGYFTETFDAGKFSSGVYLYRLEAPGGILTKKMLLVR